MKQKINTDSFNVRRWLDSENIHYTESGKNVKSGWIGIKCLWCSDHSNHLGISPTNKITCWMCGKKSIISLIIKTGKSFNQTIEIIKKYSDRKIYIDKGYHEIQALDASKFDKYVESVSTKELLRTHKLYLKSRKFNSEYIYDKYKLRCCGPTSDFCLSLFIPI